MSTNVYANSSEISSKGAAGKSLACFPDTCFTPPMTPAGTEPPIPYPNTAMASDLDKGTTTVLIGNKMVALEDTSFFKKSTGDEPAKPSQLKAGVVTHTVQGKAYYIQWSPDVKFEGQGVGRHMDMMTHNHASPPGNTVPHLFLDSQYIPPSCEQTIEKAKQECGEADASDPSSKEKASKKFLQVHCKKLAELPTKKGTEKLNPDFGSLFEKFKDSPYFFTKKEQSDHARNMSVLSASMSQAVDKDRCLSAKRCTLQKYKDTVNSYDGKGKQEMACCKGQSGHHVLPSCIASKLCSGYKAMDAPVVCVEGVNNTHGTHGLIHRNMNRALAGRKKLSCEEILGCAEESFCASFPQCDKACAHAQLEEFFKNCSHCQKETKQEPVSFTSTGYSGIADGEYEVSGIFGASGFK